MNAATLKESLKKSLAVNHSILIVGPPGCGKSTIVEDLCREMDVTLALFHPSVGEPTDIKGFPWCYQTADGKKEAEFVTYGEMARLLNPTKKTVACFDDLGQSTEEMQAALMQVLWARQLNGHKISNNVTFIGCTNDINDKAAVHGLIEPLKSRWTSIVRYMPTIDDWSNWAYINNMPGTLIDFNRFRPGLMFDFKPTKELKNGPCPRTIANFGRILNVDYPTDAKYELGIGAVGEGYTAEYFAYAEVYSQIPTTDEILRNPKEAPIPKSNEPSKLFALCGCLARIATMANFDTIFTYIKRMPVEFMVIFIKDVKSLDSIGKKLIKNNTYKEWLKDNANLLI